MAQHNVLGSAGEDYAARYLESKGFRILTRNWRCRHLEVDIIAMDGPTLVFVEVKTRSSRDVPPSELVSYKKIHFLENAAEGYIKANRFEGDARFDLIVIFKSRTGFQLEHIPGAFR